MNITVRMLVEVEEKCQDFKNRKREKPRSGFGAEDAPRVDVKLFTAHDALRELLKCVPPPFFDKDVLGKTIC